MKLKLLYLTLFLSYTTLFSYEISIDSPSPLPEEKVEKKHTLKEIMQKR